MRKKKSRRLTWSERALENKRAFLRIYENHSAFSSIVGMQRNAHDAQICADMQHTAEVFQSEHHFHHHSPRTIAMQKMRKNAATLRGLRPDAKKCEEMRISMRIRPSDVGRARQERDREMRV